MKKIDGFDEALIGVASVWQRQEEGGATHIETLVYNGDSILATLMFRDHMDYEEAREYVDFNIIGAFVGEDTPIIVWPCSWEEIDEYDDWQEDDP